MGGVIEEVEYDELIREFWRQVIELGGQNKFAEKHGLSKAYVWGALNGKQKAGAGIQNALGYQAIIKFRKKGEK